MKQHHPSCLKQNWPTQSSLEQLSYRQPGASWDTTFGGSLFAASLWQWLTGPLVIKRVVLPPASPSHPKNEGGQRAKDTSQMSFSSLKTHIEATPATSACTSLARTVSEATLNERVCREVGIFLTQHTAAAPRQIKVLLVPDITFLLIQLTLFFHV